MDSRRMQANQGSTLRIVTALIVVIAVIGGILFAVTRSSSSSSSSHKIHVVAGENFWGNITQQIGGRYVDVTSIISNPSADPHLYESDARDAAAVSQADLVIQNGAGYDDFLGKLLSASSHSHRQKIVVKNILKITGSDPNPHLWYDIEKVHIVAQAIESSLARKSPSHASVFRTNLTKFNTSLHPLISLINVIKKKYSGAPVAYTERVPGYLLADAGLSVKTPQDFARAIEEGNDPSPSDAAKMNALMTNKSIKVLLYNSQATSVVTQHVRDLAKKSGIAVVGVTETLPVHEKNYQSWQYDQLLSIKKALDHS